MSYPTVSVHIVTWNSMRFLPDLLESIMGQTYKDFNVLIIDNASTDGVESFIKEKYPEIAFIRNARNLGFAPAHNQGMRYAIEHWPATELRDHFVLLTNPDVILDEKFLENMVSSTCSHPEVASFGGKIFRAFGENVQDDVFKEVVKSDIIDTICLQPYRNRTIVDGGAGALDQGQFEEQKKVFGISGALVLLRASALADVRFQDEVLDQDFFAYKEDVDLAWRLQQAGWDALYVPQAIAYHYRGMYGPEKSGIWKRIMNRKGKSPLRNYYSTRNHWMLLVKNLRLSDIVFGFLWILPYEFGRVVYTIVFERMGRKALIEAIVLLPRMLQKRRYIAQLSLIHI